MLRPLVALVLLTAGVLGCPEGPPVQSAVKLRSPDAPPTGEPAPEPEPEPPPSSALAQQMHQQLAAINRVHRAVVAADLEVARRESADLVRVLAAQHPPEAWRSYLASISGALEDISSSEDLNETAQRVAHAGLTCGRCHEDVDVDVDLPLPATPQPGGDFESSMQVHRWAADRMWEGLVAPSNEHWIRGTTMFMEIPGCPPLDVDDEEDTLCHTAQNWARRGHLTDARDDRATVYARLLTTCAQCHTKAPPPP